ncbi:odorant receptor 2a [Scaptodrosophila lebanonensis]|uniref:Odorant receptor n=1 Tax=Drosophila lebanonensis TaxID=7225 RepID=A0A6J2TU97_DROLE|nr:odorant receptor 2a [Scaptodrosophila lebanonensis]
MDKTVLDYQSLDTHSAVAYHWRVWQLTGLLRPKSFSSGLFIIYSIVINTLVTLLFPLTLVIQLFFAHNLQALFENLTITITDIAANLKFINVFLVRQELKQIKRLLQRLDRRAIQVNNPKELEVLRRAVATSRTGFRIFAGIFIIGTILSCLRVAFAKQRELLYPAWFGIDWHRSDVAYVAIYVYQLIGLIVQAAQDCANDSYPPAYLGILTGHMRALELRVRRIGYPAVRPTAVNYESWRISVYNDLRNCIDDFNCVLKLHEIIQKILSTACMAQFICSGTVQCTVAMHFLYVADSNDLSAMMLSLVFFLSVTLEVFIICLFGERLRTQSEALLDSFYGCNWLEQLPQFKSNLLITLIRAQRPTVIFAGNYISLTLETFVQVLRITYSAFTLLLRTR